MTETVYPYRFSWGTGLGETRKNQLCRILETKGTYAHTTVRVEFQDGFIALVPRDALRRANKTR